MRLAGFQIQRSCGRGQVGSKVALMDVDADADHGKCNRAGLGLRFDQDAAGLARADQQIVGPAQIDRRAPRAARMASAAASPAASGNSGKRAAGICGRSSTLT